MPATRLDDNAWAYFSGGAADETHAARQPQRLGRAAAAAARAAPAGRRPHPRASCSAARWPTRSCWRRWPTSAWRTRDGELATRARRRRAGRRAGAQHAGQHAAGRRGPRGAATTPARGPLWFQLYLQHDRGFTRELVQRAEAAGFEALVLTVDAPVHGARDRERRAGFRLPAGVSRRQPGRPPPPPRRARPGQSALFDGLLQRTRRPGTTWPGCAAQTRLPRAAQGRAASRRRAPGRWRCGVAGADRLQPRRPHARHRAAPPPRVLPRIADAVGGALPLLVDGGIRRGTDVLKAIALGARAVLVGRPVRATAWPIAGAHGRGPCAASAARRTRDRDGAVRLRDARRCASRTALRAPWEPPGSALGDVQERQKHHLPRQEHHSSSENCFSMQH